MAPKLNVSMMPAHAVLYSTKQREKEPVPVMGARPSLSATSLSVTAPTP